METTECDNVMCKSKEISVNCMICGKIIYCSDKCFVKGVKTLIKHDPQCSRIASLFPIHYVKFIKHGRTQSLLREIVTGWNDNPMSGITVTIYPNEGIGADSFYARITKFINYDDPEKKHLEIEYMVYSHTNRGVNIFKLPERSVLAIPPLPSPTYITQEIKKVDMLMCNVMLDGEAEIVDINCDVGRLNVKF